MVQFGSIITNIGLAKISNAQITNSTIGIESMVLGDGNGAYYTVSQSQTALRNEVWRGLLADQRIDVNNPNRIEFSAFIPSTVGGFTIREVGLLDTDGNLIALSLYPEQYKPTLGEGISDDILIHFVIETSNASVITLAVDVTNVIATRQYVDRKTAEVNDVLTEHMADKENPHGVTAKQIGAVLLQDFTAHSNESTNVHGLGVATLLTSAKTLRESINELFTSVDNGKFGVRSDIIAKGGTVIGAHPNSFNELRNGIMSIPTGIKRARGTFTSASVGAILLNSEGYQVNTNYYDFDFSLLDFIPEFIFFIASNPTVKDGVAVWSHDNILHLSASQYANNIVPSEGAFRTPYSNGVVRIAMQYRSTAYTWYAYGR